MQKEGNKLDLIVHVGSDIFDDHALRTEYFQSGNVFLGAKEAVGDQHVYAKNINAVLTVMDGKSYDKEKIKDKVEGMGIGQHLFIDVVDSKEVKIKHLFQQSYDFIEGAVGGELNVLVHCKGGMSRSASFVCAYLMKKFGLTFEKAYGLVKRRRSVVDINEGFQKELRAYEKDIGVVAGKK